MTKKLQEEDRAAVDLLLDRSAIASAMPAGYVTHAQSGKSHVRSAARVLHLLDALTAQNPPADLIQRTMKRIDRATAMPADSQRETPSINREHPLM